MYYKYIYDDQISLNSKEYKKLLKLMFLVAYVYASIYASQVQARVHLVEKSTDPPYLLIRVLSSVGPTADFKTEDCKYMLQNIQV